MLSLDITGYGRWNDSAGRQGRTQGQAGIELRRQDVTAPGKKAARKAAAAATLGEGSADHALFEACACPPLGACQGAGGSGLCEFSAGPQPVGDGAQQTYDASGDGRHTWRRGNEASSTVKNFST